MKLVMDHKVLGDWEIRYMGAKRSYTPLVTVPIVIQPRTGVKEYIEPTNFVNGIFVDEDFSPEICGISQYDDISAWKRPCEISSQAQFVKNGYTIDDVIQGGFPNCYVVTAIAVITYKNKLDTLFHTIDAERGLYTFKFFKKEGTDEDEMISELVSIDDRLPTTSSGYPALLHSKDRDEFWPSLLEKAFAKFKGGYHRLRGGSGISVLKDLIGAVPVRFTCTSGDEGWEELYTLHQNGALLVSGSNEEGEKNGLCTNHCYAIIEVKEVQADNQTHRFVQIRNPWGNSKEWKGRFHADDDENWTPTLKNTLNPTFTNGISWLSWDDYSKCCYASAAVLNE
jgi:hypothetical protein